MNIDNLKQSNTTIRVLGISPSLLGLVAPNLQLDSAKFDTNAQLLL